MANLGKQKVSSRQIPNLGQRKSLFEQSKFSQLSHNVIAPTATTDLSDYRQPQPGEMIANVMGSLSPAKSSSPPNSITGKQLQAPKRQKREVNMAPANQLKAPLRQSNLSEKPIQKQEESIPNQTGLPDNLKVGIENLSGYSLDNVRVHYNSPKPAQLQALAYTQGTEIHVAPEQEKHLPHEAWHVVQQMQGRVKPTTQMKGVQINDDEKLEHEADVMGGKASLERTLKQVVTVRYSQKRTKEPGTGDTSQKTEIQSEAREDSGAKLHLNIPSTDQNLSDQSNQLAILPLSSQKHSSVSPRNTTEIEFNPQNGKGNRPIDHSKVVQRLRIGKIPEVAFRNAHVAPHANYYQLSQPSPYQHDCADFTLPMKRDILAENDNFWTNNFPNINPVPPVAEIYGSDESWDELWRQQDLMGNVLNIDHIIPYAQWGSNDFRNARVVSIRENLGIALLSRPAANSFRVVCSNRDIVINGVHCQQDHTLNAADLTDLLDEALKNPDPTHAVPYIPTHHLANPLPNVGAMTNADFYAIYYELPQ